MKKKWLSRTLAAMMTGIMAIGMLSACGQADTQTSSEANKESSSEVKEESSAEVASSETAEEPEEITYPLDTDMELSLWVKSSNLAAAYASAEESPFHTGLAEKTGLKLAWQFPAAGADVITAFNLMLQEKELPNMIWDDQLNMQSAAELYEDGLIYDLTEYLPTYAPDYWAYINSPELEDAKRLLTTEEGKILYVGTFTEGSYNVTYIGPIIRQDWLDECNLETPVTLEDWENVLRIFKDKYGAVFSLATSRLEYLLSGTGAYGGFLYTPTYVDDNNKICSSLYDEEWKELLVVLNRWYEEGLLDPDFMSLDNKTIRSNALNGKTGVTINAMSQLTNYTVDAEKENTGAKWVGFSYPRTAEGEATTYLQTRACEEYAGYGGVMVSTSCSEEELITALKFLNYGFTEEGGMYWNYGEEGVSYTLDENGEAQWTELITEDSDGIAEAIKKYASMGNAGIGIQQSHMVAIKNSENSAAAVYTWTDNTIAPQHTVPILSMTNDELSVYTDKHTAITTYVSTTVLQFITGEASLDDFDEFVAECESMGLQDCIDILQAAFDRYLAK